MAYIERISIEHFRGFYDPQTIEFARPSGVSGSGLSILVGPNNSGKTTVIDALKLLAKTNVTIDIEHRHEGEVMRVISTDSDGKSKSISNPDGGAVTVTTGDQSAAPSTYSLRFVPSRRAWSAFSSNQPFDAQNYWSNIYMRDQNQNQQDDLFVSRIAEIAASEKEAFQDILQNAFPRISNWRVERSRGQLFIQYETPTGARHSADLFGDGLASIFRVALSIYDCNPTQCLVIDEPELSLHPQAQKRLASYLSRISATRQIILTTHSPYLINISDMRNGGRVYRLVQRSNGVKIFSLTENTLNVLYRLMSDWQKPNLLDIVAREIFFAEEIVFFEGQEDVGLIRKFAADKNVEPIEIFGYGVAGSGNIKYFLRMATELGLRACAVFDSDKMSDYLEAKNMFPQHLIECLPTPDIRDKQSRSGIKGVIDKEGIFDSNGEIKPEYEHYLLILLQRIREHFASSKDP